MVSLVKIDLDWSQKSEIFLEMWIFSEIWANNNSNKKSFSSIIDVDIYDDMGYLE